MKITVHLEAEDIERIVTSYVQDNLHIQGQCAFTYTPSPLWVEVTQDEELEPEQNNIFTWVGRQLMTEDGQALGKLLDIKIHSKEDSTFVLVTGLCEFGPVRITGQHPSESLNAWSNACLK
jgi:hypothetical protein